MGDQAEQVERVGLVRLGLEHAAIALFCLGQTACPVMRDRRHQPFLRRVVRVTNH